MTQPETNGAAAPASTPAARTRPLSESAALAAKTVQFLCEGKSGFSFDTDTAAKVVPYLRWVSYPAETVLYREGDDTKTSYMLLVLEGDVSVDTASSGRADRVAISVLGPGALIGEMALLDGAARSANCTAITTVQCAGMSHAGLEQLAQEHPAVAFKLLVYMARHTADRLRMLSDQLNMYDQINANLRQALDRARGNAPAN